MSNAVESSASFVLIVDDDEDYRALLSRLLSLYGFHVLTADDGLAAAGWLDAAPTLPSLILLDMDMPVLDGPGFLTRRANTPRWRSVPVIVVSGSSDIERKVSGLDVASAHQKPFQPTRLIAQIKAALHQEAAVGSREVRVLPARVEPLEPALGNVSVVPAMSVAAIASLEPGPSSLAAAPMAEMAAAPMAEMAAAPMAEMAAMADTGSGVGELGEIRAEAALPNPPDPTAVSDPMPD